MKRFLGRTIFFLMLVPLFLVLFFQTLKVLKPKSVENSYLKNYYKTLQHIEAHKDDCKIVFIGGSNLAFGLSAEDIEKEFGIPVFNFGVKCDIGIKKPINDVRPYLNKCDIVILSPEYENLIDADYYASGRFEVEYVNYDFTNVLHSFKAVEYFAQFLKKVLLGFIKGNLKPYSVSSSNYNGDIVAHKNSSESYSNFHTYNYNLAHIDKLAKLCDSAFAGVNYYLIPPVTFQGRLDEATKLYLDEYYAEHFNYPIKIDSMTFGRESFFDTDYHLKYDFVSVRTGKVSSFLKQIL